MNCSKENSIQTLRRFLGRHFNPSREQVEAAGERVLQRLLARTAVASQGAVLESEPIRMERRQWNIAFVFATVAVVLLFALSASLWWAKDSNVTGTMMTLADGSSVEMQAGSEATVGQVADGLRIHLKAGSIIVNAAKQAAGRHLQVQTRDVTVSVVGTVFLVKAEERGSRVAVIEGEVHVQHGNVAENLRRGEQMASNPKLEALALQEEIGWSREAAAYLALLHRSLAQNLSARQAAPRTASAPSKPHFEKAEVHPCEQNFRAPDGMRGGGSNSIRLSPGRLDALCMTVATLIRTAFRPLNNNAVTGSRDPEIMMDLTHGLGMEDGTRVRGGPEWVLSEQYTIVAVADGPADARTLARPMLLDLLQRRFQLKVRVDTEPINVWALVVGRNGLKIKPIEPGSCVPMPPGGIWTEAEFRKFEEIRGTTPACEGRVELVGTHNRYSTIGAPLSWIAESLSKSSLGPMRDAGFRGGPLYSTLNGRLVLDKTGIPETTVFNFGFDHALDADAATRGWVEPNLPPDPSPNIFDALEQLGLELQPSTASREFIVIEHIERPSTN